MRTDDCKARCPFSALVRRNGAETVPHQKVLCPITHCLIGSFQTNHSAVTVLRGIDAANRIETDGRAAKQPVHRPRQHQVLGRPTQHLAFLRHQP